MDGPTEVNGAAPAAAATANGGNGNGDSGRYQEMLGMIAEVEASVVHEDKTLIDMEGIPSGAAMQQGPKRSYQELVDVIDAVGGGGGARRRIREVQERKMPQPSQHLVTSGVAQSSYSYGMQQQPQPTVPAQQAQPQKTPLQLQIPIPIQFPSKETLAKHGNRVAKELGAIAGRLSSFKPALQLELRKKRIKISDLVLPSLSLADQISEVERIIEGLREGVFDKEHMEIVSQEIFGLQQVVDQMRKEQKGTAAETGTLEKSLTELRDQRLSEAASLIGGG
jgi:uncharacterized protein YoaH (UPF0181 family)